MLRLQLEERRRQDLARAAEALWGDYQTDPDLTVLAELDREDFR